jgi:putative ABC transport system permease protein
LQEKLGTTDQPLLIRSNRDIQGFTLEIFDRTFTITNVLRLLAILVAVVGVLSALLALQLERAREFAVLRATGMTTRRNRRAGVVADRVHGRRRWLAGATDRAAAGGGADFRHQSPGVRLEPCRFRLIHCCCWKRWRWRSLPRLLAGLYPIWRMARARPADALRTE